MTAFFGKLGGYALALGGFLILILTSGRSKKKLGAALEKSNQLGEALERIEDGKRITDQIEKDLAALTPDERALLLHNKFGRD